MEIGRLADFIEEIPNQGMTLSQVEAIRIMCSLRLLQNQMKSDSMFFLGKILALDKDYYIAFSTEVNNYIPSIFYCSQDTITWFSLCGVDIETKNEAIELKTPLTGSLISEFTLSSGRIINEEIRLSSIVSDIFENCFLIPRGYVIQTALDNVLLNPLWNGIQIKDVHNLKNFRHWRPRKKEMTPLEKSLSNPATDFLDQLIDLTEWSFSFTGENDEIQMRSLRWPGFVFDVRQTDFCNFYFGNGVANTNVIEMVSKLYDPTEAHKSIQ
ncbi:radial spoke head protein 9 [Histomonas meleagridis]|uniref:radial spoke head protein 9-like n=1 Tax=Histomonas meleagridis TaxID=135588 RepID=UPI003559C72F|nr:radial spoke head protein 9 [Histomonas meleagridis]KAH0807105.1 radial spoke head protein 9-like [Histomonas meleagridis]